MTHPPAEASGPTRAAPFADRLERLVADRRSQICLGLDPDPMALGGDPDTELTAVADAAAAAAAAVTEHCRALIDRAGSACVAVKAQLACFERLGAPGWTSLADVRAHAADAGLLFIADGKRGDVPVTAAAYAQALLGETPTPWGPAPGLGADAITANPLLGRDSLEPLIEAAANSGAGVFSLVRTSNPGAADLQDQPAPSDPLHERLAGMVDGLSGELMGSGELSGAGAVVGATEPGHINRLRELMPRSVFLIPGVGAQGGRPEELGPAFSAGQASALVAASRSIANDADPGGAAESLRARVWEVSAA